MATDLEQLIIPSEQSTTFVTCSGLDTKNPVLIMATDPITSPQQSTDSEVVTCSGLGAKFPALVKSVWRFEQQSQYPGAVVEFLSESNHQEESSVSEVTAGTLLIRGDERITRSGTWKLKQEGTVLEMWINSPLLGCCSWLQCWGPTFKLIYNEEEKTAKQINSDTVVMRREEGERADQGETGVEGAQGEYETGETGSQGAQGESETGETGAQRAEGESEANNEDDKDDMDVGQGTKGRQRLEGLPGLPRLDGDDGMKSNCAESGDGSVSGIDGAPGDIVANGPQGEPDQDGFEGAAGDKRDQGTQGAPGDQHEQAAPGKDGIGGVPSGDGEAGTSGTEGVKVATGKPDEEGIEGSNVVLATVTSDEKKERPTTSGEQVNTGDSSPTRKRTAVTVSEENTSVGDQSNTLPSKRKKGQKGKQKKVKDTLDKGKQSGKQKKSQEQIELEKLKSDGKKIYANLFPVQTKNTVRGHQSEEDQIRSSELEGLQELDFSNFPQMIPPAPNLSEYIDKYDLDSELSKNNRDSQQRQQDYEAEVMVYRALEKLQDPDMIVLHGLKYTHGQYKLFVGEHKSKEKPGEDCKMKNKEIEQECDFLVMGPSYFLVIEVKNVCCSHVGANSDKKALLKNFESSVEQRNRTVKLIEGMKTGATVFQYTAYPNLSKYDQFLHEMTDQLSTVIFKEDIANLSSWWSENIKIPTALPVDLTEGKQILLALWSTENNKCDFTVEYNYQFGINTCTAANPNPNPSL